MASQETVEPVFIFKESTTERVFRQNMIEMKMWVL